MTPCVDCQNRLLDHLYGLLDEAEGAAVEAHLAACPACAAARERAGREQRLLASAAKASFPHVLFSPPSEPAAAPRSGDLAATVAFPSIVPFAPAGPAAAARPRGRHLTALAWAVAACLAVAAGLVPGAVRRTDDEARIARQGADAASARLVDAVRLASAATRPAPAPDRPDRNAAENAGPARAEAAAAAQKDLDAVRAAWFESMTAAVRAEKGRKLAVEVSGPAAIQPGAPNRFTVVVHDRRAAPDTREIEAQVCDEKDRVLFHQHLDAARKGDSHDLRLPADLWARVRPDSDLFLVVATVDAKTGVRTAVQDKVRLLGPIYATVLATDKPLYRPGERVFFRSLTLDRTSFLPPDREQELRYELRGPDGRPVAGASALGTTELARAAADGRVEPVAGPDGGPLRGVGCGAFDLPADLAAGEYTLGVAEVRHPAGFRPAPPATRRIAVRPHSAERFQKKLEFGGASFAGGDTVGAWCEVREGDAPVAGAAVEPVVTVDGRTLRVPALQTGADGRAAFRFTLPAQVDVGDVRLRADVRVGGATESVARRVPVVGRRVAVEIFPEGGEAVAGVPCRFYLRATDPLGRPVDVAGTVTDGREAVARVETFRDDDFPGANRGLGAFSFTPKVGTPYWLKLDRPAGAAEPLLAGRVPPVPAGAAGAAAVAASRTGFPLPPVKTDGVAMSVPEGVHGAGKPIAVELWSVGRPRNLVVGAYARGRLVDTQALTVTPGRPSVVTLAGAGQPRGGVTRITAFQVPDAAAGKGGNKADLVPCAERLVYRKPAEELELSFDLTAAAGGRPEAGGDARLSLRATDGAGRPVPAVLYAAAVDENAAAMADGKLDRLLTSHFLLAGEVEKPDDLEHVDFLLSDGPKAAQALDLLLGTQGWRRFAEQHPPQLNRRHAVTGPEHDRLVYNGQLPVWPETFLEREKQRSYTSFWPRYEAAARRLEEANARPEAPAATAAGIPTTAAPPAPATTDAPAPAAAASPNALRRALDEREARTQAARAATDAAEAAHAHARPWAWAAGGAAVLLLSLTALSRRGGWGRRLPLAAAAVAAGLLAFALGEAAVPANGPKDAIPRDRAILDDRAPIAGEAEALIEQAEAMKGTARTKADGEKVAKAAGAAGTITPTELRTKAEEKRAALAAATGQALLRSEAANRPDAKKLEAENKFKGQIDFPIAGSASALPPPLAAAVPALPQGEALALGPLNGAGEKPSPAATRQPLRPAEHGGGLAGTAGAPGAKDGHPIAADAHVANAAPVPQGFAQMKAARAAKEQQESAKKATNADRDNARDKQAHDFYRLAEGRGGLDGDEEKGQTFDALRRGAALQRTERKRESAGEAALERLEIELGARRRALASLPSGFVPGAEKREEARAYDIVRDSVPLVPPLLVREYARPSPAPGASHEGGDGADDAASVDTILWQPVIVLPGDGAASFPVRLNAEATAYRVIVAGHTLDGRIGATRRVVPVLPAGAPATK